jgi:hypothetical protein
MRQNHHTPIRLIWLPLAVIALWFASGWLIKDRLLPNYDILNDYENAVALLHAQGLPAWGAISSFGSVNPPGVSYGMLAGIVFGGGMDPGAAQRMASVFWFGVSLIGLFLFLHQRFGRRAAILGTLIYGFSGPGAFFAVSMWPRAHPAFLIWLLYFADRWCLQRNSNAIGWIIAISAFATYWMLEFLPALLVLPLLWMLYRPPLHWRPVLVGSAFALALWWPYLHLQQQRDWRDLHALLLLKDIGKDLRMDPLGALGITDLEMLGQRRPTGWDQYFRQTTDEGAASTDDGGFFRTDERFGRVWVLGWTSRIGGREGRFFKPANEPVWYFQCDTSLLIYQRQSGWENDPHPLRIADGWKPEAVPRWVDDDIWKTLLLWNFRQLHLTFMIPLFFWLAVGLLLNAFLQGARTARSSIWYRGPAALGLALLWGYALYYACVASPVAVESVLLFAGIALLIPVQLIWQLKFSRPEPRPVTKGIDKSRLRQPIVVLLVFLLLPWVVIALLSAASWPSAGRRFLWLFILQAAVFAIMLDALLRMPFFRGKRAWAAAGFMLVLLTPNSALFYHLPQFKHDRMRWQGIAHVDVIDTAAAYIARQGWEHVAVGYDIPFRQFHLHWNAIDNRYKVGREMDALLLSRHGIANANQRPEGIHPKDDLVIVDKTVEGDPSDRFWDLRDHPRRPIVYENARWVILGAAAGELQSDASTTRPAS